MVMKTRIQLDFNTFVLDAELFDTDMAKKFAQYLPYDVSLTGWGNELYGTIGKDLGEENPVEDISAGGIAYTNQGNYVCIFFGQKPAWAVEYIGRIPDNQWQALVENPSQGSVIIRQKTR